MAKFVIADITEATGMHEELAVNLSDRCPQVLTLEERVGLRQRAGALSLGSWLDSRRRAMSFIQGSTRLIASSTLNVRISMSERSFSF
jgi:hypothetical protein